MKQAELEAMVLRMESTVESLQAVTKALHARIEEQINRVDGLLVQFDGIYGDVVGYDMTLEEGAEETDEQRAMRMGLKERVTELEHILRGRNRSAPIKRNMMDQDAIRVLTGDAKDLGHKEAGELVGLTYAQVYSCRLEYTFKHVHKELREKGWKNHWAKK